MYFSDAQNKKRPCSEHQFLKNYLLEFIIYYSRAWKRLFFPTCIHGIFEPKEINIGFQLLRRGYYLTF